MRAKTQRYINYRGVIRFYMRLHFFRSHRIRKCSTVQVFIRTLFIMFLLHFPYGPPYAALQGGGCYIGTSLGFIFLFLINWFLPTQKTLTNYCRNEHLC